jgi:hypothetical protein
MVLEQQSTPSTARKKMAPRIQPDRSHNDTDPMQPPPGGYQDATSARDSEEDIAPQVIDAEGGEGNREADRAYRDGVANTLATKDVDALADEAKQALEGPEGPKLRAAEKRAKASPVFPKKNGRH